MNMSMSGLQSATCGVCYSNGTEHNQEGIREPVSTTKAHMKSNTWRRGGPKKTLQRVTHKNHSAPEPKDNLSSLPSRLPSIKYLTVTRLQEPRSNAIN